MELRGIEGFDGWWVRDDGTVWTVWEKGPYRNSKWYLTCTIREAKYEQHGGGYLMVRIHRPGETPRPLVHRLVLTVFVGPPSTPEHECCHNDSDKRNNSVANLRWGTRAENVADSIASGAHQRGVEKTAVKTRGRKRSQEFCDHLSAIKTGVPLSDEHRAKVRANHWSKRPDAKEIAARSGEKQRGRKHTEEHKQRISDGNRKRWDRWREERMPGRVARVIALASLLSPEQIKELL